jgi:hypothetical protein
VPYEGNRLKTPSFVWLWRLKERVINLRPWQRMQLEEASKLLPIHRPPLTAAVEPFPPYPGRSMEEPPYMCQVEGHPVIADVPSEFGTERGPEGGEALLILPGACPLLDPLELSS